LADIISRCLAIHPEKRFANVQAVLGALDSRALQRARRPLLMLGAVGPVLLLLVMFLFAVLTGSEAVKDTTREITERIQAGNRITARFAAEQVADKILQRWAILEREA